MTATQRRDRLRALLEGAECLTPASVFDPISACVAKAVGYEIAFLSGAVASKTTLAAPDLCLITLTEVADQVRRIVRASELSLIVDADHGYGNALNVRRTIQELEHAGASAVIVEDTALPRRFSLTNDANELISVEEMKGKLGAALQARQDPSFIVVGRTAGLTIDVASAIRRARTYEATGIDAIFIAEVENLQQLEAISACVKLPIMIGSPPTSLTREQLGRVGVRAMQQGHQAVPAVVKALTDTYTHLFRNDGLVDLNSKLACPLKMEDITDDETYRRFLREYLE